MNPPMKGLGFAPAVCISVSRNNANRVFRQFTQIDIIVLVDSYAIRIGLSL